MSMIATVRQISMTLLDRITADPALIEAIVSYRPPAATPSSDPDAVFSLLPAHMRDAIDQMPADARSKFIAGFAEALSELPGDVQAGLARRGRARTRHAAIEPADVGRELDVEKAGHGVHFLLCGIANEAPPPLGDVVLGGTPIGGDLGYGPARYLDLPRVKAVSDALRALPSATFASRFDADRLEQAGIYPQGWSEADRLDWLADAYSRLRAFYSDSAQGGWAVLLCVR